MSYQACCLRICPRLGYLPLVTEAVCAQLRSHPLLVEAAHLQLIVDVNQLLAAGRRVRYVQLDRTTPARLTHQMRDHSETNLRYQ